MNLKYLLFLFFPIFIFSQSKITIKVVDDKHEAVSRGIVVINQLNNQIAFGTTNNQGIFENDLPLGTYIFNIKKLGYAPIMEVVTVKGNVDLTFVMLPELNQLEDVVIKARPKILRIKEDTISYNLKAVVDGTENKIEDVIKKLPGLEVDADGKIFYKGEKINNVLIDGNEFFGNKHQMATQNINAEMIEGIDLYTNYSGFAIASGGDKGVALNLKTKDSYKSKWVSDAELGYGGKKAMRFHTNSFKFFKKGNLAIISDYNTIGNVPISLEDYSQMKVAGNDDAESSRLTDIEVPSFLNPTPFYKEKNNKFIGLNYTSLVSARSKITFSNTFNAANLLEENYKTQTNLGVEDSKLSYFDQKKGSYVLNNTAVKWEFNKSANTFLSYVVNLTPTDDEINQNLVSDSNRTTYKNSSEGLRFSQVFKVQTTFLKDIKYKGVIRHATKANDQKLGLSGDEVLFDFDTQSLEQRSRLSGNSFDFYNSFSLSKKSDFFGVKLDLLSQKEQFENDIDVKPFAMISVNLKKQLLQANFSWTRQWTPKIQSVAGVSTSNVSTTYNSEQTTYSRVEPNLNVSYNLGFLSKVTLGYSLSHRLPLLSQLLNNNAIDDFQTINSKSLVAYNKILSQDSFFLNYFNVNAKTNSVLFSSLSFNKDQKVVSNNVLYQNNYVENQATLVSGSSTLRGIVSYDLKIKKMPFSIKSTIVYLATKGFSEYSGVENEFKSNNFSGKINVNSNFENSNVQVAVEYKFSSRRLSQSLFAFNNVTVNHQVGLKLRGKSTNKLKWDLGFVVDNQDSSFNTNQLYFLNGNVQYLVVKNLKLLFSGNNMLNLKSSQLITTAYNQSFFTESVMLIMPGYMMVGINYSL